MFCMCYKMNVKQMTNIYYTYLSGGKNIFQAWNIENEKEKTLNKWIKFKATNLC